MNGINDRRPPEFAIKEAAVRVSSGGAVIIRILTQADICFDFRFPINKEALNIGHLLERAYMHTEGLHA